MRTTFKIIVFLLMTLNAIFLMDYIVKCQNDTPKFCFIETPQSIARPVIAIKMTGKFVPLTCDDLRKESVKQNLNADYVYYTCKANQAYLKEKGRVNAED